MLLLRSKDRSKDQSKDPRSAKYVTAVETVSVDAPFFVAGLKPGVNETTPEAKHLSRTRYMQPDLESHRLRLLQLRKLLSVLTKAAKKR
jgi:hypothetical protein